jgi:hypothetical protein
MKKRRPFDHEVTRLSICNVGSRPPTLPHFWCAVYQDEDGLRYGNLQRWYERDTNRPAVLPVAYRIRVKLKPAGLHTLRVRGLYHALTKQRSVV